MSAQRDRGTIREFGFERIPPGRRALVLGILASVAAVMFVVLRYRAGQSVLSGILIFLVVALPFFAIVDLISLHKWHRRGWETVDIFWLLGMFFFALVAVPIWFVAGRWIRARELERARTGIDEYRR